MSRTGFFKKLGAEFANMRWSWCAVHHEKREVYFGVWDVESTGASGRILSKDWERPRGNKQPGFSDALHKINLIEDHGYKLLVFEMEQGQKDRFIAPSKIAAINETLVEARLVQTENDWFAVFSDAKDEMVEAIPDQYESSYPEGLKKTVTVTAVERNSAARAACIQHFGDRCQACKMHFEEYYGEIGHDFIHVHHRNPLAFSNGEYKVDPKRDLVPLCPNCHAMVHRTNPPMNVEDLEKLIRFRGASQ